MIALDTLDPAFAAAVRDLLAACAARGFEMRPYSAVRTPREQARLYRQGRTLAEITARVEWLRARGAVHLAACIVKAGPQHGRRVTGAWPGASWHQFGEAVDCFPVVAGKADWRDECPAWACYAAEAERLGLTPGRNWGDGPHVQARSFEPVRWGAAKIDAMMVERFPELATLG